MSLYKKISKPLKNSSKGKMFKEESFEDGKKLKACSKIVKTKDALSEEDIVVHEKSDDIKSCTDEVSTETTEKMEDSFEESPELDSSEIADEIGRNSETMKSEEEYGDARSGSEFESSEEAVEECKHCKKLMQKIKALKNRIEELENDR